VLVRIVIFAHHQVDDAEIVRGLGHARMARAVEVHGYPHRILQVQLQ
jgi:hypothetical protein